MRNKFLLVFFLFSLIFIYSAAPKSKSIFIDEGLPSLVVNNSVNSKSFHIFSHGKPGELFIDNQWLDAPEIAVHFAKELKGKQELYIYGCNFGEGEVGRKAVQYLQNNLNISVNASTNMTGKDGDWVLEIGKGKDGLKLPNYNGDLQLDKIHYLNPIICGIYSDASISEEFIYLSTPSTTDITVQMNYASGTGAPRVSVRNLTTNAVSYSTTGSITFNNANPVRLQFVNGSNAVIAPGTTPITVPRNLANTNISGNSAGLKFTSADQFFVNYRARSTPQAGSVLTKGAAALGKEFRWGGSPIETTTPTAETGNMISVMATEDNATVIKISNIKPGTSFVNGSSTTLLTSSTFSATLQKGESFILYAPVVVNQRSIQDDGWLGARVISDKNVAVTVGGLLQAGSSSGNRDIGLDQIVPVTRLGLEHVVMKGNGLAREKVIVVSTVDNTDVFVNGSNTAFATLAFAGDYVIIPSTSFNSDKNMLVRVSSNAYVFHKIYGSDRDNTNSLMFIPPLSCFGQKSVDLVPDATKIGTTAYGGTELVVLAAVGSTNIPVVKQGSTTLPTPTPGAVSGNGNWISYRYALSPGNVKVSSAGTIQAEIIGASGDAGFGGYYSGFGDTPSYNITYDTSYDYPCRGISKMSVPAGTGNTYQWYRNGVAISGATTNIYQLDAVADAASYNYYVLVTFPGGCSVRSNQVTSATCPCSKPPTLGTPAGYTKVGISIRDKHTTLDWPNDIGNGFIALESNKKGFVITRMDSPETKIQNAVIGMLVYDTLKDCLKIYDGSGWKCIKQTCN